MTLMVLLAFTIITTTEGSKSSPVRRRGDMFYDIESTQQCGKNEGDRATKKNERECAGKRDIVINNKLSGPSVEVRRSPNKSAVWIQERTDRDYPTDEAEPANFPGDARTGNTLQCKSLSVSPSKATRP
jgi:hypothetical protein